MTVLLYEFMLEKGVKLKYRDGEPYPVYPYFSVEFIEEFEHFIKNHSK